MLITWLQMFLAFGMLLDLVAMWFFYKNAPGGALFVAFIAFIVWGAFTFGSFAVEYPVLVNSTTQWVAKNDPALPWFGVFGVFLSTALVIGSSFELMYQEVGRV